MKKASRRTINFTKESLSTLKPETKLYEVYDSKTQYLIVQVRPSGLVTFYIYRKVANEAHRKKIGPFPATSIEVARKVVAKFNGDIAAGATPSDIRKAKKLEFGFDAFFLKFLDEYAKPRIVTWADYEAQYTRHIKKSFGGKKLNSITVHDVELFHNQYKNRPATGRKLLTILSSVFTRAEKWGYLKSPHPVRGIERFPVKHRDRVMFKQEKAPFFEALLQEKDLNVIDFIIMSVATAARRTNVLDMKWDQIEVIDGEYVWTIPRTKTDTMFMVPLTKQAVEIIERRRTTPYNEYVFGADTKARRLLDPKSQWRRVMKKAGIRNFRKHDLRRTNASTQYRGGVPLDLVGDTIGDVSREAVRIYARSDLETSRKNLQDAADTLLPESVNELLLKKHLKS